jgi:hypothetical protein
MSSVTCSTTGALHAAVASDGFAFVQGGAMRELLAPFGDLSDWAAFAASWNQLELDTHMADGGRYRRRRYAAYAAPPDGSISRKPHQPHFQAIDYNPLNGGIARWFEPIAADIGSGSSMRTILGFCSDLFGRLANHTAWQIEVHQFRIEARSGETGRPTPEGLHRDGVDYVLVLLIDRRHIASGMTRIHGLDGRLLGHFTLEHPFDAAIVDDNRVAHGVTPVEPLYPSQRAHRDVLVVTFKKDNDI